MSAGKFPSQGPPPLPWRRSGSGPGPALWHRGAAPAAAKSCCRGPGATASAGDPQRRAILSGWLRNSASWLIHVNPMTYGVSTCFNHSFGAAGFLNHPQHEWNPRAVGKIPLYVPSVNQNWTCQSLMETVCALINWHMLKLRLEDKERMVLTIGWFGWLNQYSFMVLQNISQSDPVCGMSDPTYNKALLFRVDCSSVLQSFWAHHLGLRKTTSRFAEFPVQGQADVQPAKNCTAPRLTGSHRSRGSLSPVAMSHGGGNRDHARCGATPLYVYVGLIKHIDAYSNI